MHKLFKNSTNNNRWWDWPAAILLIAALLTATTRLVATRWTEELPLVQTVAFLGAVAGLALGQSSFSLKTARIFAFLYGLFIVPWQLGLTIGSGTPWPERMVNLGNRLLLTIDHLLQQRPVTDNMFFLFLMSSLFWAMSVYAGYNLTRHARPWPVILPAGLALIVIQAYDSFFQVRTWFLAGYIFLSLLILARLHYLNLRSRWRENGTYLPPFVSLDSIRLGLITTAILVLFAWTAPALASAVTPAESVWRRATMPWISVRERLSNAFSSLQASVGVVTDFYGDTLPLGRGNPLTDTVIMTVHAPPRVAAGVRYYWKQRTYDYYDNGWSTSLINTTTLSPTDAGLALPEFSGRMPATFLFETKYPIQNLHSAPQPVWVSRQVEASLAQNPDGTVDLGLLKATPYLAAGETYQVEASLSAASITELRAAGTDYPEWVAARYLQIPEDITPRTVELAAQVTAGLDNPYDKVEAVTNFLRNHLTYAETVPVPPSGQEPIDWILFDHRQAFCNYYASAEIIMLRSLGIPARLAVGYSEGERTSLLDLDSIPSLGPGRENVPQEIDTAGNLYTVRHRDAHAWPEVFFPGLGWVEFEPTVSQLPIFRPAGGITPESQEDPVPENSSLTPEELLAQDRRNELLAAERNPQLTAIEQAALRMPWLFWAALGACSLGLVLIQANRLREKRGLPPIPVALEARLRAIGVEPPAILRRWVRFATLSPLTKAYLELNRALSRLGKPAKPKDTPAERAETLQELLPAAATPIQNLLFEYQSATYSQHPGDIDVAQTAGGEIRKLSFLALLQRFLARFQEPRKNKPPFFRR
jgi:transglutaminase-like putative cysteine protease